MHAGGAGEVARHSFLAGNIEDVAACAEEQAAAVGRECPRVDEILHIANLGTGGIALVAHLYVDFCGFARCGVEFVDVAPVLKHYDASVGAWKFHVVLGEISHLGSGFSHGVVAEQVHGVVAVACEENLIANPHGEVVLSYIVGDIIHFPGLGVINPDVVGHTALVVFPGAELAEHAVVGKFLSVGRVAAETAFGQWHLLRHSALGRDGVEASVEARADAVAIDDILAVAAPAHHHIVGTHAVGKVVAGIGCGVGESGGRAAGSRHEIHLGAAVVLSGEGNLLAIGRKTCKHFITLVRSEMLCLTTLDRSRIQVAGVGKHYFLPISGREAQQASLVGARRHHSTGSHQRKNQ